MENAKATVQMGMQVGMGSGTAGGRQRKRLGEEGRVSWEEPLETSELVLPPPYSLLCPL